jgi:hypothetical protein
VYTATVWEPKTEIPGKQKGRLNMKGFLACFPILAAGSALAQPTVAGVVNAASNTLGPKLPRRCALQTTGGR